MPRWLFAVFTGIAVSMFCYYGAAIAERGRKPGFTAVVFCGTVMMFLLPWHSGAMFTVDYALNYLFPTALVSYVLYRFITESSSRIRIITGLLAR